MSIMTSVRNSHFPWWLIELMQTHFETTLSLPPISLLPLCLVMSVTKVLSNSHGTVSWRLWKPRGAVTGPMCMPPSGQGLQGPRISGLWAQRCPLLIQSGGNSGSLQLERQRARVWLTPCQMGWTHAAWGSCLDIIRQCRWSGDSHPSHRVGPGCHSAWDLQAQSALKLGH